MMKRSRLGCRSRKGSAVRVLLWALVAVSASGLVLILVGAGVVGWYLYRAIRTPMPPAAPKVLAGAHVSGEWRIQRRWEYGAPGAAGLATGALDGPHESEVALSARAGILVLDDSGKLKRQIPSSRGYLEMGRRGNAGFLLRFDTWGQSVAALAPDGRLLWEYRGSSMGVDWAAPIDRGVADGDDTAVGYNGSGGLHDLTPSGALRWRAGDLGNVWCVCGARLVRGEAESILAANARGTLLVYSSSGARLKEIQTRTYVDAVFSGDLEGAGVDDMLTLGSTDSNEELSDFDSSGHLRWHYVVSPRGGPGERVVAVGRFLPAGRQVAVASPDGTIALLDSNGKLIACDRLGVKVTALRRLHNPAGQKDLAVVMTPVGCTAVEWTRSSSS